MAKKTLENIEIDAEFIHALGFFASAKSYAEFSYLDLNRIGLLSTALDLVKLGYVDRRLETGLSEEASRSFYSINERGMKYAQKVLKAVKKVKL